MTDKEKGRTRQLLIRVTPDEYKALKTLTAQAGETLSEVVHRAFVRAKYLPKDAALRKAGVQAREKGDK